MDKHLIFEIDLRIFVEFFFNYMWIWNTFLKTEYSQRLFLRLEYVVYSSTDSEISPNQIAEKCHSDLAT